MTYHKKPFKEKKVMFQIAKEIIEKMKNAMNGFALKPYLQTAGSSCSGCSGSCYAHCGSECGGCSGNCDNEVADNGGSGW